VYSLSPDRKTLPGPGDYNTATDTCIQTENHQHSFSKAIRFGKPAKFTEQYDTSKKIKLLIKQSPKAYMARAARKIQPWHFQEKCSHYTSKGFFLK